MTKEQGQADAIEDEALDPAVERLRGRLIRFMIINLVVVFGVVGLVVGVLVYRNLSEPESDLEPMASVPTVAAVDASGTALDLGPGEEVVSMAADGPRVTLLIRSATGIRLLQVDIRDGAVRGELRTDGVDP